MRLEQDVTTAQIFESDNSYPLHDRVSCMAKRSRKDQKPAGRTSESPLEPLTIPEDCTHIDGKAMPHFHRDNTNELTMHASDAHTWSMPDLPKMSEHRNIAGWCMLWHLHLLHLMSDAGNVGAREHIGGWRANPKECSRAVSDHWQEHTCYKSQGIVGVTNTCN